MLTQDYLVRMLVDFAAAVMRSVQRRTELRDPQGAAEMLEGAVGEAVDMDGATLLSLSPDSIATIMQVSGTDPAITEYVARSLLLAAAYRSEAGDESMADLRAQQARAIARAYGHDVSDMDDGASLPMSENATKAVQEFFNEGLADTESNGS